MGTPIRVKPPDKGERRIDVLLYSFMVSFFAGLSILGILAFIRVSNIVYLTGTGMGLSALATMFHRIAVNDAKYWAHLDIGQAPPDVVTEIVTEYVTPSRNHVLVGNQWIYQPQPGVLAGMLRDAIDSTSRRQFSWRIARQRGYTEAEFTAVCAQLRVCGWLTGETVNGAPAVDVEKLGEIGRWLSPHPE